MKEPEKKAIKELIQFYKLYIADKDMNLIKKEAIAIESKYLCATAILGEDVNYAVSSLTEIYANTGISPPSKEEAKNIIEKLKKREAELDKEK